MGRPKIWRTGQIALALLVATTAGFWLKHRHHATEKEVKDRHRAPSSTQELEVTPTNVFDSFIVWSRAYISGKTYGRITVVSDEEQIAQGVSLAQARRDALKGLIRHDPEQALRMALPFSIRRELPAAMLPFVEERVSGRGELAVMSVLAGNGAVKELSPVFRIARIGAKRYEAFVYGQRLGHPTRLNTLVHGIAVDNLLAVHEHAARVLERDEAIASSITEGICGISGREASISEGATSVQLGDEIQILCSPNHVDDLNLRLGMADGAPTAFALGTGDTAASSVYTTGEKRVLIIRVDFSDLSGEPFSEQTGLAVLGELAIYFRDASFGKLVISPAGQGSDVTPTFRMPNTSAYYGTNNLYEQLRADARRLAEEAGYAKARYEFDVICFGNVPGWIWAGLAYVGGPGAWLRNSFGTSVAAHELGHNLGLNHANFWDTGAQSAIGPGSSAEYGDTFDTMGGGAARAFNARYRAYLNWITADEIAVVSGEGIYRLDAYDVPSTGVKALKVERHTGTSATNSYWLEFRQRTNAPVWLRNGAGLRWGGDGGRSTLLLDVTPGSAAGKDDSALGIGRTFVDSRSEVYITVLAKAGTNPESLDILVKRGPFPGNAPPVLSIDSSLTNVPVGGNLQFRAAAFDPDNDALAFAWDFGDGTHHANNSDAVSHEWDQEGEFVVRCIVSDMRGGQASDWRTVRVGAPRTYRISGRVTTQDGVAMEGVRVHVSDGQVVYSRSDGQYSVVGLATGNYNLRASGDGWGFSSPGFRNPITVGPNAENINFFGGAPGQLRTKTLVGFNATWSYLDDGSNQGSNWTAPNFNDASWKSGVSELGYGDGDEATTIRSGTPLRFVTSYFRHAFYLTNQSRLTSASLRLLRDDGGVVYLNGREVFRSFMPAGLINYNTLALFHTEGWAERARYETDVDPDALVNGRNLIAVEIHQASTTSPDLSFDLNFTATELLDTPRGIVVVSPTNNAVFSTPANIYVRVEASAGSGGTIRRVDFLQGNTAIGESTNVPFSVVWSNVVPNVYSLRALGIDNNGLLLTSAPVNITVQAVPAYVRIADISHNSTFIAPTNIVISADASSGAFGVLAKVEFFSGSTKLGEDADSPYNMIWSNAPPGMHSLTAVAIHQSLARMTSGPVTITVEALRAAMLVRRQSTWKYYNLNSDPGPAWHSLSYNDLSWPAGTGPLGAGDPHVVTTIGIGPAAARHPTVCLRRTFGLPSAESFEAIVLRLLRDDGAAVYLNNVPVLADGVSLPSVFSQYATQTIEGTSEGAYVQHILSSAALRPGTNVLAIEVKNASATSDDLAFDLELEGLLDTGAPKLRTVEPPPGSSVDGLRFVNVDFDSPVTGVDAADLLINNQPATGLIPINAHEFTFTFPEPATGLVQLAWSPSHAITDASVQSNAFIGGRWTNRLASSSSHLLLLQTATWHYLDNGSDPGPIWSTVGFDDLLWRSGKTQLGYGDGDENTRISYGVSSSNKHITYYFRKAVIVPNPSQYDAMPLSYLVDDGAVIYVNGIEAVRTRMPGGSPRYNTLATVSGDFSWETVFLSADLFVDGRNVIAVEVHQAHPSDSDVSFDLSLAGQIDRSRPRIASIDPAPGSVEELSSITVRFTEDVAGVDAADLLIDSRPAITVLQVSRQQYIFSFQTPSTGSVQVVWAPGHNIADLARSPNILDAAPWSYVLTPLNDDITLVAKGAAWRYLDNGVYPGTTWTSADFDDSQWRSGRAQFGYGDGDETTIVEYGPNPSTKHATTYFRRRFVVNEPAAYGNVVMELTFDDGAIVYVNGIEVQRVRIAPEAIITHDTYIGQGADYPPAVFSVSRDTLMPGTNIIAVEMHQAEGSSADLSFDLQVLANRAPSIIINSPGDNDEFLGPTNVTVAVAADDKDGHVASVDFFDRTNLVGQSASSPFSLVWSNVTDGNYFLTARARDNFGATRFSAPVLFSVTDPSTAVITTMHVASNEMRITFSKRLAEETALNPANYAIDNGVSIQPVSLSTDLKTVTVRTSALLPQQTYVLTVRDITDLNGQPIAPGTQRSFMVEPFQSASIGPDVNASTIFTLDGYEITAGGALGIGGAADNFFYYWEERTGDFDVQVRVESLDFSDLLAKAGLMVRERLIENSRFAAVVATPAINGCFLQYRTNASYRTIETGSVPTSYPTTWLRLKRHNLTNFTGFASADGRSWMSLGSTRLSLPQTVYFGLAVTSRNPTQRTTASFSALGTTASTRVVPSTREPLGPSTRRGPLVISEIMYHPSVGFTDSGYPDDYEFIEIYNSSPVREDVGDWSISGSASFTFPSGTTIPAGGFLLVAANPPLLRSLYGLDAAIVFGPYSGHFRNPLPEDNGGTVQLRNEFGGVVCDVSYGTTPPWPPSADGAGHSLILARPSRGERDVAAWAASDEIGGSPGRADPFPGDPLDDVCINELLTPSHSAESAFVELHNRGNTELDLSGCQLIDDADTIDEPGISFLIPDGTRIAPRGFILLNPGLLFAPRYGQRWLYLINAAATRVLDTVELHGHPDGISGGRYPDGAADIRPMSAATPGVANAIPIPADVVINEIMYHPPSGNSDEEFIELYNRSADPVNVSGWRLSGGVQFTFPLNTVIPGHGFFIIAGNIARLRANHSSLSAQNSAGNFDGSLGNDGERLVLSSPKPVRDLTGRVLWTTYLTANEVNYGTGGRWGKWSDGGGSSLELIDPRQDNRLAPNWADSDETQKAPWTTAEFKGLTAHGSIVPTDNLQLFLQGPGECLLDDVEIFMNSNPASNFVRNGTFEQGATNWSFGGTHEDSSWERGEGHASSASLHLRGSRRGDVSVNCVRTRLSAALTNGSSLTIRAKARWLKGDRFLLLRLRGNSGEAACDLQLPATLGTPGARNSRYIANSPPAIHDVAHWPVLPSDLEPVVVTCRASDADGLMRLNLVYRLDPTGPPAIVPMADDGSAAHGDARADDGVFSALIPGLAAGTLVAFYIDAADPAAAESRFPSDAPVRECLVRFGDTQPPGNLAGYRLWFTQATRTRWEQRQKNSATELDCTFVYNNYRVIYNAGTLYAGSAWHTPSYNGPLGGTICDYELHAPPDDRFLNADDMVFAAVGNNNNDPSAVAEQGSYWIARKLGVPWTYRRFVHMFVMGARRGLVFEDAQQPNQDFLDEYFPDDSHGPLHRAQDWFEFSEDGDSRLGNVDAKLTLVTTTNDVKWKPIYREWWRPRSTGARSPNDFEDLFALVDAVNAPKPQPYTSRIESLVDLREWMAYFAFQHIVGNWDSYGYRRGNNAYIYKPADSRWVLMPYDVDFDLGYGGDGTTQTLFDTGGVEPRIAELLRHPPFERAYWRAYRAATATGGPLQNLVFDPVIDSLSAALRANGIAVLPPTVEKNYVEGRRSYILSQLPQAPFAVSTPGSVVSNVNWATITGTAPIDAAHVLVNGSPAVWTNVLTWTATVALNPGQNSIRLEAIDSRGRLITDGSRTVLMTYTGIEPDPREHLAISEIMYKPAQSKGAFIELQNKSSTFAFDLSRWRIEGVEYTFPPGFLVYPTQVVAVVEDIGSFLKYYGTNAARLDQYPGQLDPEGERIALIKPGTSPDVDTMIDKVFYEQRQPWPPANENGSSLQVIDVGEDNSRVSNWTDGRDWKFFRFTGVPTTNLLMFYFTPAGGEIYLDDIYLCPGNVAESGPNLVRNPGFEEPFSGSWITNINTRNTVRQSTNVHSGASALRLHSLVAGGSFNTSFVQTNLSVTTGAVHTISFWYFYGTNAPSLRISMSGTSPSFNTALSARPIHSSGGLLNSTARDLPSYEPVWVNELQVSNVIGLADNVSEREPWVELYNNGTNNISLASYHLSDDYSHLTKWSFPPEATLAPGFRIIWLDGETGDSSAADLHAGFRPAASTGSIVLSRSLSPSSLQIVDYLNYPELAPDTSYGNVPDGDVSARQVFYNPTPAAPNTSSRLSIFINEWMAANQSAVADPSTLSFADWFELYNAHPFPVDLSGHYLSDHADTLAARMQFRMPNNTVIPGRGYLVIWADGEMRFIQHPGPPGIHANFRLNRDADRIFLYAPDARTLIDSVAFDWQWTDITQGRFPDGGPISLLPRPTPGTANVGNTAPQLQSIVDKRVLLGQTLSFHLSAMDLEAPPQLLTFTIQSGPARATLDPLTGLFKWTPAVGQAPGTNQVIVSVADNGTPPLNHTRSFLITAYPSPYATIMWSGATVSISFETVAGRAYQPEYADSLIQPVIWQPLGPPSSGSGQMLRVTDSFTAGPQRFYRVRLLD